MKKVKGFPGYFINEQGDVWSLRLGANKSKKEGNCCRKLVPHDNGTGHLYLQLRKGGKWHKRYVHRLVLENFVGQCPKKMVCRHLDGNPQNNHVSNLCWGTRKENEADKVRHGTSNRGENNGKSKLTEVAVAEIRFLYAKGDVTQLQLGEKFGVSDGTICNVVNNKAWQHPAFKAKPPEGK